MNSFETGCSSINLYIHPEIVNDKTDIYNLITLSKPSFFELHTKIIHDLHSFNWSNNNFQLLLNRNNTIYKIEDNNDVLRLEHEDCISVLSQKDNIKKND